VATIAKDDIVDVIVEVPEKIIRYVTPGMDVNIKAGGKVTRGKVFAIIPKGDISTRTIPVKIRVKNNLSLIEGMQAGVSLPMGEKKKALIVARDAIINIFGTDAVFAVIDSKAKMIPVKVIGYKGMEAGIYAKGLSEGMSVVIKGNERLRDGQMVRYE
jgi:multidrug efflux pump subunit AcrA (membrane-fusion protein)